jgi:hypothetical protein
MRHFFVHTHTLNYYDCVDAFGDSAILLSSICFDTLPTKAQCTGACPLYVEGFEDIGERATRAIYIFREHVHIPEYRQHTFERTRSA